MDKKKILQMVMGNAQKAMQRSMSDLETIFIKRQLRLYVEDQSQEELCESFPLFMRLIIDGLKNPNTVHKAMAEPQHVDIHEMLKVQLLDDTIEKKLKIKNPNDITRIFGMDTTNIIGLQKVFNPLATVRTAYILLDRKFQSRVQDTNSTFTWQLSISGQGYNPLNSAITTALPKNVVGAKIIPFRFPRTEAAITFSKRISIEIQELNMHAYVTNERRRFHFMFSLLEDGVNPNDPYILANSGGENTTEFWLGKAVQEINSITLTFGNPFTKLRLDPDRLPATITSVGVQAVLTFAQPHFVSINDTVTIEDFDTNNPVADFVEIQLMSDETGWPVVAATATTLTINVDLSGLIGVIAVPTRIYLESKRFIIPLELKYLPD